MSRAVGLPSCSKTKWGRHVLLDPRDDPVRLDLRRLLPCSHDDVVAVEEHDRRRDPLALLVGMIRACHALNVAIAEYVVPGRSIDTLEPSLTAGTPGAGRGDMRSARTGPTEGAIGTATHDIEEFRPSRPLFYRSKSHEHRVFGRPISRSARRRNPLPARASKGTERAIDPQLTRWTQIQMRDADRMEKRISLGPEILIVLSSAS